MNQESPLLRHGECQIAHEASIRGKKRIDLEVDPPPDLAIEIDVTSRTHPSLYAALQVPELWRFNQGELQINILGQGLDVAQYQPEI
jgi:Uma2 family endonuclease